jgi:hypothetical protein
VEPDYHKTLNHEDEHVFVCRDGFVGHLLQAGEKRFRHNSGKFD